MGTDHVRSVLRDVRDRIQGHVDIEAAKRMSDLWEKRRRPAALLETNRISQKLIEKAKPHVLKESGRVGGLVTAHMRSAAQRSESARKAAKARWRKQRARERETKSAEVSA